MGMEHEELKLAQREQALIQELIKTKQEQKQELEFESFEGYELPPRTQFSMLKKPAVSIKYGKMTFNMACIRLFEGIQYILPLVNIAKKRLAVAMCVEEESASVEWARFKKNEVWVNKDITSVDFIEKIYQAMGWRRECRYKVLGRVANSDRGLILVFDLDEALPQINPFARVGEKVAVTALPAPKEWTTPRGLEVFGPRSFGHEVEYKPYC